LEDGVWIESLQMTGGCLRGWWCFLFFLRRFLRGSSEANSAEDFPQSYVLYKILITILTSFQIVDIFSLAIMNAGRIINRNKFLYGPGPLGRRPTGLGARPPLQGLVICAMQGIAVGLVGGLGYNVMFGNPLVNSIETYYKEHPSR